MVQPTSILNQSQRERDEELAKYLKIPAQKVIDTKIPGAEGPPLCLEKDFKADSYEFLYEKFHHTDEITALKSFSQFIVNKRSDLIREARARAGKKLDKSFFLDFGCGVGSHGIYMLEEGAGGVDFLDVEGPAIKYAKWRTQQRQLSGDIEFLNPGSDLKLQKYDVVLCIDVMEHIADPMAEFRKIMRSMKVGGLLVLQVGKKLNPRQGHFAKSRDIWLSKKMKRLRGIKLQKLSTFFYRRK